MAYAELWMPIRNAISNMNQTINTMANREAQRSAQGLRNLMAMDDLVSSKARRDSARAGGLRAQKRLDADLAYQDFQKQQSIAAAERAERQLELQEEDQTFNQRIRNAAEARAARIAELQEPVLRHQAAIAEQYLTPRDVNIYSVLPQEAKDWAFEDTNAADMVAKTVGGPTAIFDPQSGQLIDSTNGQPIQRTGVQISQAMPGILGIVSSVDNPDQLDRSQMEKLQSRIQARKDEIKKTPKGVHDRLITRKASLEQANFRDAQELQKLKNQPAWKRINRYEVRQQLLENLAAQYVANGGDNGATVDVLNRAIIENSDRLQDLYKQKEKALVADPNTLVVKEVHKLGENGEIVPGTTRIMSVPKVTKSVTPRDVDPSLPPGEWVFGEDIAAKNKSGGRVGEWVAGSNLIKAAYGVKSGNDWMINPEDETKHRMAFNVFEPFIKKAAEEGAAIPELTAGNQAVNATNAAFNDYWVKFNQFAAEEGVDLRKPDKRQAAYEIFNEETPYGQKFGALFKIYPDVNENPALRID